MTPRNVVYGFTLIEVLIAVAILSFGMLGIAAMQITGVRANRGSYYRTQATYLANDVAERLYANIASTRAGEYDGFDSNGIGCGSSVTRCSVDPTDNTVPADCSQTDMRSYDRFVTSCGFADGSVRRGGVKDLLPDGRIVVACAAQPLVSTTEATPCTITVSWTELIESALEGESTTVQVRNWAIATTGNQRVRVDLTP